MYTPRHRKPYKPFEYWQTGNKACLLGLGLMICNLSIGILWVTGRI